MVGSADFNDEAIDGQVNMALVCARPGIVDQAADSPVGLRAGLDAGDAPCGTCTEFPRWRQSTYIPARTSTTSSTARCAFGRRWATPTTSQRSGDGVCRRLRVHQQRPKGRSDQFAGRRLCGERAAARPRPVAPALGAGEIPPLEMAGAFGALANGGRYIAPYAITRIEDLRRQRCSTTIRTAAVAPQAVRPEHAITNLLTTSILSDNNARLAEFGQNNNLVIPGYQVAAKTGTSGTTADDVRDAWTIGYAPQVLASVWVGNTTTAHRRGAVRATGWPRPSGTTFMLRI